MHCRRARARIQTWFDAPGAAPMPPEVAAHVRECQNCRTLITRWNAIELRLQAMKEERPDLSPSFAVSLRARLRRAELAPRYLWLGTMNWRVMATAAAALIVAAVLYGLTGARFFGGSSQAPSPLAVVHPAGTGEPQDATATPGR